ncbi:uncharacterized protein CLBA1 isoform X2 [Saimiri boliviensis]|uniref:uncharacterized protein CLBA1 isoform X2 n=1 Tax=Saimiri boliviensis TaxID=27679 RepID=UPI000533F457|nr:uncharacterized protein CLBA1 isoform X2 [Saimiri boliviensis boliviensis]
MQDRQELEEEPLSDFQTEAAKASLRVAPEGLSDDTLEWIRISPDLLSDGKASNSLPREGGSTCTTRCPDPGEHSSTWGEFEGFREFSAKSGQFSQSLELLEGPTELQPPSTTSTPKECSSHQLCQGGPWVTGTAAIPPSEPILSYENILKCAFQEITVQQAAEDISTLDHFLEISSEEKPGHECVHKLCNESRKLWRVLQNTYASASQCLWSESHCQENFFLILGIDAMQKDLSGGQGHIMDDSDLKEPEGLLTVSSFRLHHCKALIQTKGRQAKCEPHCSVPRNISMSSTKTLRPEDPGELPGEASQAEKRAAGKLSPPCG